MTDEELSAFEALARPVGRKRIPREWRSEILEAALPDDGRAAPALKASESPFIAVGPSDARDNETTPRPPAAEPTLEGRIRIAERRATWSMAACFVLAVFLIALLIRPRPEPRAVPSRLEEVPTPMLSLREGKPAQPPRSAPSLPGPSHPSDLPLSPPPPSGEGALAKAASLPGAGGAPDVPPPPPPPPGDRALAGRGADAGQIEEAQGGFLIRDAAINDIFQMLAKRDGKQYFHNNKLANQDYKVSGHLNGGDPMKQMEDLAFMYGLSLHEKGNTIYALNQEQLNQLPTEKVTYPLRSIRPDQIDTIKEVVQPLLSPTGIASYEPETHSLTIVDSARTVDRAWDLLSELEFEMGGQAGPGGGRIPEDPAQDGLPLPKPDRSLAGARGVETSFAGQINHAAKDGAPEDRPLDLRSRRDESLVAESSNPAPVLEDAEMQTISLIDRVPIIVSKINESEVSNQVTEEVRYQVDQRDLVGDPATTREIGVTFNVSPTLLPDGTVRLKMRPRSAQMVEEIIGQSGNKYSRPSESMLESVARVPSGHSLVLGGFYGQVTPKDDQKAALLRDVPVMNFFFKGKETAKEPTSLLLVATPTVINERVSVETKILSVNRAAIGRAGVNWSGNPGSAAVPPESIDSLNSLLGIEKSGEVAGGSAEEVATSDRAIVLSPGQVERVLGALNRAGMVTQVSNPTVLSGRQPLRDPRADLERHAAAEPWSTFSLHVSDVSFKLARTALARGKWPTPDQVRVEEFVNAFDYGDPAPSQREKVSCAMEQAGHPFLQQRNLLRVSMKTAALGRSAETPLRLTVLLDKSGSMERMDRADSVKRAFQLLADQLTPRDQVTLIGFARTPRLLADRLTGNRVAELSQVVDSTPSEGGTNLELALELGTAKAKEQWLEGGQNRVILLTDGAANLGNANPEELARLVEGMRRQGIAFDACGVGAGGLNDGILESLTRKGDGRYYLLDSPADADDGFARADRGCTAAGGAQREGCNWNSTRPGWVATSCMASRNTA